MATLTLNQITKAGLDDPAGEAAAGGGDQLPNDGKTYLRVANGGGSACVVTIDAIRLCDFGIDHDAGGSVPNGDTWFFGPFPVKDFSSDVAITYNQVTTVTVTALRG